jgi:hypothetical protein
MGFTVLLHYLRPMQLPGRSEDLHACAAVHRNLVVGTVGSAKIAPAIGESINDVVNTFIREFLIQNRQPAADPPAPAIGRLADDKQLMSGYPPGPAKMSVLVDLPAVLTRHVSEERVKAAAEAVVRAPA